MTQNLDVLVIIPAKMDSTRLKEKNIRKINGKTLVEHSIDYARASTHRVHIVVSSESQQVQQIATQSGAFFMYRTKDLIGDAEVTDVYIDVVNRWPHKKYDLVVGLQPDNPNRDLRLDTCITYMRENNYDDLITVNENYKRSGSVRIFKYDYLAAEKVSKRVGCVKDTAIDIHTKEDLKQAEEVM